MTFSSFKSPWILACIVLLVGVTGFFGWRAYTHAQTYGHIENPKVAHHHFGLKLLRDNEPIDFSEPQYQEEYVKGQCSAELTETPIHFHDGNGDTVHIHWTNIRGGEVLKYYGLNLLDDQRELGTREDTGDIVDIKGDLIPASTSEAYWVYTGSATDYESREIENFLRQDLETFFGRQSSLSAHTHALHTQADTADTPSQEELQDIQNHLGNVVIFNQDSAPEEEEIVAQFESFTPLSPSVCGG